jgi:ATP-dependent exoDNAse (exonuclease V) beta subunit
MQNTTEKPLKILNASAGSGKTFNLVKEYIQLLLCDAKNTYRFANIIAMTFTNKAALEMKSRIIQALDQLSFPDKYKKKSDDYAFLISESLGINPEEVHTRTQIVLKNILHRYEDFHVMTIDKFNLKLIRSFSRDLNLPNDFEIILNENEVIERVVDTMMSQLGQAELEKLTQLVFSYAKENIEEGEKWDFRKNLIQFASILQKENYFSIVEQLMESDFSKEMLAQLKFEKKRIEDHFVGRCKAIFELYQNENINEKDLPGGSRTANPIIKLNTYKTIPSKDLFTSAFLTICENEVPAKKVFPANLRQELISLHKEWLIVLTNFTSISLYIKNFYNMALLQFMAKQLDTVRKDEQLIRISEFNKLISELVKNEEAPFIYERLGTRFHHFLLDEFQDTSHLQWLNMVPLLHESISQENSNLIVGDPKQSIYRFKNGVAEQFVELPAIYNPDKDKKVAERSAYFSKMGETIPLEENWRSSPIIVNFNNQFFESLRIELDEEFKPFYNSVSQNPKSKKEGYIEIISKEIEESSNEIPQLLEWINSCEKDGFKRGDICILGNKNKECSSWAIALSENGYEVVSADSLLVDSSPAVQLTIAYLRRRLNPLSENEKRRFGEKYFRLFPENAYQNYKSYLIENINSTTGKKYRKFDDDRFLAENFGSKINFFTKYENIYDLIQKFYALIKFDELSNPYLHHLADMAHEYDLTKGPDLKGFVEQYLANGKKSAVQLPESENAIKIMSIHKSKGLEFPVVILPKMEFDLVINNKSKFLISTENRILYTPSGKESPIEEIKSFTEQELGQIKTDSINKCYVAMTRPIERLYINHEYKKASKFAELFNGVLSQIDGLKTEIEGGFKITLGEQKEIIRSSENNEAPHFIPKNVTDRLWFPDISLQDQKDLTDQNSLSEAQRFGNQLHILLSIVNDVNEIDSCINDLNKSGEIEVDFIERLKIETHEILRDNDYKELFVDCIDILSEQPIIIDQFTTIRPDKIILKKIENDGAENLINHKAIILDYKTGLPDQKYSKQVTEYALVLKEIGYVEVEAYLFYTTTKKLERII